MLNLREFKKRFRALRAKGFVRSQRPGPTGVGHTLEAELGLGENNIAVSDLTFAELKAHRVGSSSLITLFTFNRKVWQMKPLEAVRRYGTLDDNGRLGLYFTMSVSPTSTGLVLRFEEKSVDLRHLDGTLIASWEIDTLAQRFNKKFPALVLVTAECEERNGVEYFRYVRAQLLTGVSKAALSHQFRAGKIVLDLRLHDKVSSARNHGTGFRVFERDLPSLFAKIEDI